MTRCANPGQHQAVPQPGDANPGTGGVASIPEPGDGGHGGGGHHLAPKPGQPFFGGGGFFHIGDNKEPFVLHNAKPLADYK